MASWSLETTASWPLECMASRSLETTGLVAPRVHEALELGHHHRAVVARLDPGVRVELETPGRKAPAGTGFLHGGVPRRHRDLVEQVAGQPVSRLRQHWQGRPRR